MKKLFLFSFLAVFLAGLGFGGISMATCEGSIIENAEASLTTTIGKTSYCSFSDAIESATSGDTVKLLKDINLSNPLIINKDLTLDLNNSTITNNSIAPCYNGKSCYSYAIGISGGTVTISGGTISGPSYVLSVIKGKGIIENGFFETTKAGSVMNVIGSNSELIILDGTFTGQETTVMAFDGAKLRIEGGTFTTVDNFVIGTNGSSGRGNNNITINGGTFNGNITTANYIACGIYAANNDIINVNAGTFNVTKGAGVVVRGGTVTIGKNVVFNVDGSSEGRVGDSKINVPAGKEVVMDIRSNYPGNEPFKIINNYTGTYLITSNNAYTVSIKDGDSFVKLEMDRDSESNSAKITEPTNPADKEDGSKFDGWYNGEETTPFDFSTAINGNVELVSKWYKEISTIELTGIVTPVSGDAPSIDGISTTTTGITLTTKQWQDNANNQTVMAQGDKFAKGNPYTLYIEFSVDEGYKLADEVSCGNSCTVTKNTTNSLKLTYTAEAKKYTVTWDIEGQKTTTEVEEGSTPTYRETPTKAADNSYTYSFSGWSLDGKNVVDLSSQQITSDVTYTAIFTATKKTTSTGGGGGGGGSSSSSCKNLPSNAVANNTKKPSSSTNYFYDTDTSKVCSFVCKEGYEWNKSSSKCEVAKTTTTGDKTDEPKVDETKVDESTNENTGTDIGGTPSNEFSKEFNDAYTWAFKNGITTMDSIEKADMNAPLTRIAMAKMLSQYAINVLGKTPDTTKVVPTFPDVDEQLNKDYNDGVTLAYQLGIMGINIDSFRPFDLVTRAEFGTALSRMLFGLSDGEEDLWYKPHLDKLMNEKIITIDTPDLQELRGYVMIMLMRSAQ